MSIFWLTVYVLIWPVIVRAFWKEWRQARSEGRGMI